MKKLKKVTILCLIAAISVLIAIGCSNDNSSDEPETQATAAATEDTQTPTTSTEKETTTTTTTTPTTPADNPSSGSEDDDEPGCDDTHACPSGQTCVNGECVAACIDGYGTEGPSTRYCRYCGDGIVQADAGETCDGENCQLDCSRCEDGYRLVNGVCVALKANETSCDCNGECASGFCDPQSGKCKTRNACGDDICASGSRCVNGECQVCDDTASYGTPTSCRYCGDGIVQADAGEACDGEPNCTIDCRWGPRCGDGRLDYSLGEQCDDGNLENGDGCSCNCQVEN